MIKDPPKNHSQKVSCGGQRRLLDTMQAIVGCPYCTGKVRRIQTTCKMKRTCSWILSKEKPTVCNSLSLQQVEGN